MSEELKLIEGILAHAEDEKTNRSWASDDVGWENVDAIWHKAEQLKKLLKEQKAVEPRKESDGNPQPWACWWYVCGDCGQEIDFHDRFCRWCGRSVKWE